MTIAAFLMMVACEQSDLEDTQVLEEGLTEFEYKKQRNPEIEIEAYPIMVYDQLSAKSQLQECENGIFSYMCLATENILQLTKYEAVFARPKRPRFCPMPSPESQLIGEIGPRPRPICEPDLCKNLLRRDCIEIASDFKLAVKAASPDLVSAFLYSGGELITSTTPEHGGSVTPGWEFNSAQLNFGIPLSEVAEAGMVVVINTSVFIDGHLVESMIKADL